jgi:hypothetical protein
MSLRVVKAIVYRDAPVKVGVVMAKADFHEDHVWQALVASGHLEEQDGGNAGQLSHKRPDKDPQN